MVRHSRLDRFLQGRLPRLAVRWPRMTGLTSYLSGCNFDSPSGGAVFSAAEVRRFCLSCQTDPLPVYVHPFAFPSVSGGSSGTWFSSGMRATCWCTGATVTLRVPGIPLAPKRAKVFTRIAVVSGTVATVHGSPPSPWFAGAGGVRPPPEGLVNAACRRAFRPCGGTEATSWLRSFPGHPGLSHPLVPQRNFLSKNFLLSTSGASI
jgi:hypothetical protein